MTSELTPPQKAVWRRALTGPRALSAMAEYIASEDRAAALDRFSGTRSGPSHEK